MPIVSQRAAPSSNQAQLKHSTRTFRTQCRHCLGKSVPIALRRLISLADHCQLERCKMFFLNKKIEMPKREMTLPGRSEAITTAECHHVLGRSLQGPFPANSEGVIFGMGCFWGAERKFWNA